MKLLKFNLFDSEYGVGHEVTINPAFVASIVSGERRANGSHFRVATITMSNGATHVVTDSSHVVGDQIAEQYMAPAVSNPDRPKPRPPIRPMPNNAGAKVSVETLTEIVRDLVSAVNDLIRKDSKE